MYPTLLSLPIKKWGLGRTSIRFYSLRVLNSLSKACGILSLKYLTTGLYQLQPNPGLQIHPQKVLNSPKHKPIIFPQKRVQKATINHNIQGWWSRSHAPTVTVFLQPIQKLRTSHLSPKLSQLTRLANLVWSCTRGTKNQGFTTPTGHYLQWCLCDFAWFRQIYSFYSTQRLRDRQSKTTQEPPSGRDVCTGYGHFRIPRGLHLFDYL